MMTDLIKLWIPRIGFALTLLLVFWLLSKLAKRAILGAGRKTGLNEHVVKLIGRTAEFTLVIIGLITALGTVGIDVSALVAGLGLTGFALGFALRDTISNLLAGVLLLIYQPFKISDRIRVVGFEGTVTSIDLRYTTLEGEKERALIPNANLFTNPISIL